MLRNLISLALFMAVVVFQVHGQVDTLLQANTAKNINIWSSDGYTSITATSLNGGRDNFFYETGKKSNSGISRFRIQYSDVKDVTVSESDSSVNVSFVAFGQDLQSYNFRFYDPDNRTTSSYLGTSSNEFGFRFSRKGEVSWDLVSSGLSLGWVGALNANPDFDASMGKSNELSWRMVLGIKMSYRRTSLALGFGINWQNFVTKGPRYFCKGEDGVISLVPYEVGSTHMRSRIKIFSWSIPLIYSIDFDRRGNWGLNVGPILNFNTYGSIKTQYRLDNGKFTFNTKDIGQRRVTIDLYGSIQYKSLSVFVKYSPMKKLNTATGLEFNSISTGLSIGF